MTGGNGHAQCPGRPVYPGQPARTRSYCALVAAGLWMAGAATAASSPAASAPAVTKPAASETAATQIIKVVGQSDPATRREAALAILKTQSPEGMKALLGVFDVDNNEQAKIAVCEALAAAQSQIPAFIPRLEELLRHKNPAVRKAAAVALAGYADPQATASVAAYQREQERVLMAESLERLMDTLYDATTDETKRGTLLLEWLKSPLAVQRLKGLQIVYDALRGKGTKPANEVLAQIRIMLTDSDVPVRLKVIAMLRDLGIPEDAARLRSLLDNERSAAVRAETYKALGKLTDPASIQVCIAGLGESNDEVAAAAVDALGHLCEKGSGRPADAIAAAVNAILARLARPVDSVLQRRDLVEAMADIADPRFTPLLVKYAGPDELEPTIRQAALRGLERIGDPVGLNVLLDRLVNDPDAGVREVAAAALGRLGSQPSHLQAFR
ncbi:MAG TPA: HEAT repeat domain-containing protein, partial [Phycisphaerae bacterium]|nr:HEAT repeat domain-containing protein [Phycisphaerae bacterium]